jgi:hypothetical protein
MEEATRTCVDQRFVERNLVEAAGHMNTLDLRGGTDDRGDLRAAIDAARARQRTPGDERTPDQRNADALVGGRADPGPARAGGGRVPRAGTPRTT